MGEYGGAEDRKEERGLSSLKTRKLGVVSLIYYYYLCGNREEICTCCDKYSSKLDISCSFVTTFVINRK